ncbi:GIY-YIG nuclease family protein [Candidatus Gottesmanbacteria bacterium]|nr:GIY-YIG nuclease family protein [Candidatus Gottesmanbacteria bacterium]
MFYTYVLQCIDTKRGRNKFYIGSSENLKNRVDGHLTKSNETTKSFDKIKLVYYEACLNKKDALVREKQLKTGFGRGYIKRRLLNYLTKRA